MTISKTVLCLFLAFALTPVFGQTPPAIENTDHSQAFDYIKSYIRGDFSEGSYCEFKNEYESKKFISFKGYDLLAGNKHKSWTLFECANKQNCVRIDGYAPSDPSTHYSSVYSQLFLYSKDGETDNLLKAMNRMIFLCVRDRPSSS
jgi:hypothetical protein